MVIVVFRTHVKPQADLEKLNALNQKMVALVSKMPGFLSIKDFSAQDGEFLVIAEFDSLESVDAWKAHPEHLVAQQRGREEFFADYRIQVCNLIRTSDFTANPDNSTRTQGILTESHYLRAAARPNQGAQATAYSRAADAWRFAINYLQSASQFCTLIQVVADGCRVLHSDRPGPAALDHPRTCVPAPAQT